MTATTKDKSQERTANVLAHVRAANPSLQPSDAKVANVVLEKPEDIVYRTVSELAEMAGTSTATVVRFAQKLGFRGFHDLKLALARDLANRASSESAVGAAVDQRLSPLVQVAEAGARTVAEIASLVDPEAFEATVARLAGAERILFCGVGTSAPLAQDAAYRFSCIGLAAAAPADVHGQHLRAALLDDSSACVLISHTGSTRETLAVAASARAAGAGTVGITSFSHSPLTESVDHVIVAGSWDVSFRRSLQREVMASRLAHLAVLDALLIAVADRDEERARRALAIYGDVLGEHRL